MPCKTDWLTKIMTKNEEDEESDENKEDYDDAEKECPGGGRRLRNR